jgi:hypothetical protein
MKARQPVQVDLTRDDVHRLSRRSPTHLNQTRRVIAQVILADGSMDDIERVVHMKGEIIERAASPVLPDRGNRFEIGGFAR